MVSCYSLFVRRFGLIAGLLLVSSFSFGEPFRAGSPPDPPSVASVKQWVFRVAVTKGKPRIDSVRSVAVQKPTSTPRRFGRFAIELYVGKELLDRIRFDVPLLAEPGEEEKRRPFARPTFDQIDTVFSVQMADSPRAAYIVFRDRATDEVVKYWWPPEKDGALKPMAP